jgi:predicted SAM-dependent methyltransferase
MWGEKVGMMITRLAKKFLRAINIFLKSKTKASKANSNDNIAFSENDYLAMYPDVAEAVNSGVLKSGYEHYLNYGVNEGRAPSLAYGVVPRENAVFHLIDKAGLGLEIGPSFNPIAPKKKGYKVHVLDHANTSDLRAKYKDHGVDINNIEEVDFVWQGQPLPELIGKTHCYDWIIASHVVEHIPDLIRFFQECQILLKPKGVLSLVVPDKRYCFDHFQPLSTTGALLDAYAEKRTRPSSGQVFDSFVNAAQCNGSIAWSKHQQGEYRLSHNFSLAKGLWERGSTTNEYIDTHCWRFMPESFRMILSDLNQLGLIGIDVREIFPTNGCEFYVSLGREDLKEAAGGSRLEQLIKITDLQA